MAPCLYALLALALPKATISQTVVVSGTTFTDDFTYQPTGDYTGVGWYFPQVGATSCAGSEASDDLGSQITTCSGWNCGSGVGNGQIWGWWKYCGDDPARSMARVFECDSRAKVTVEVTFYGCIENTGSTTFYLRVDLGSGFILPYETSDFDVAYSTSWSSVGTSPTIGGCYQNYRSYTKSLTFDVEAGQTVGIEINHDLNGNDVNDNWAGFNDFEFTCATVPTPFPTPAPTDSTDSPSTSPSRSPTRAPSPVPTPAPTDEPSRSPLAADEPTPFPTVSPSEDPTVSPSADPTVSPTKEPSFAPIPAPTPSPERGPTTSPTEDVGLFEAAFGGGNGCADGWISCNIEVFVMLVILGVGFVFYWILGSVWYKRRQNNRPVPAHMSPHVEMGGTTTGAATHATSSKWKSKWELEQEAEAAQAGGQQPGYEY